MPLDLERWAPGLHTLRHYRREWLADDVVAGLALTAVLIPVGMGYAEASGVPAIHGLYATILPLLAYAIFGPSRIMVLGPDSTLAAVIAALILPLAHGSAERAVALAATLALLTGLAQLLIGFARLGMIADLFSKPVRLGFLNAIALTVIIGQCPKLLGLSVHADALPDKLGQLARGVAAGQTQPVALAVGAASLVAILLLKRHRPEWPAVLLAVVVATATSAWLDLGRTAQLSVLGPMPHGLPAPTLPWVGVEDLARLVPGAAIIALLSFADTSVLSRSLAARGRYRVSQDQEMLALGAANLASGLFQGFSVSSSASRTPVAEAAGSRTQLTGLVGAAAIALLLLLAPTLLAPLPSAVLGAIVIVACLSFADPRGMWALHRQRPLEFGLSVVSFLGVALIGVIEGIALAISLSLLVLVWKTWHPYSATLVRVDGRKGWHDAARHPNGHAVPGLVIFRWDAPLFFANAEIFHERALAALDRSPTPARWLVVAADAITDIDITAADTLLDFDRELVQRGVEMRFAGMKGPVKDRMLQLGLARAFPPDHHVATVGSAVSRYREHFDVDWRERDEH